MQIAGSVRVVLTVSSDAEDTAFAAKLIQVSADGTAVNIRESITPLGYRNAAASPMS